MLRVLFRPLCHCPTLRVLSSRGFSKGIVDFDELPPLPQDSLGIRVKDLVKENKFKEAEDLAKELFDMDKQTNEYINDTVMVGNALTPHNPALARVILEEGVKIDSTNADLLHQLGMVHVRESKFEEAISLLDQALQIDKEHCPALCGLASVYTKLGKHKETEGKLSIALAIAKRENSTMLQGSVLVQYISLYSSPFYVKRNGMEDAISYAEKILFDPGYANFLHTTYIVLYHQVIKTDLATYGSLDTRIKSIAECHNYLKFNIHHTSAGKYDLAMKNIKKCISAASRTTPIPSRAPLFSQAYYRYALALKHSFTVQGDEAVEKIEAHWIELLAAYNSSLSHDASYAPAWVGKADILMLQRKSEEALSAFETALHHGSSETAHIYHSMASLYRKLKQIDKAIEYSKKALQLNPKNEEAKLELFASMMEGNGPDITQDEQVQNLSEEIRGSNPEFQDYFDKNKDKDPNALVEEFNAFVDNNIRPPDNNFHVFESEQENKKE